MTRPWLKILFPYLLTALLSLALPVWLLKLWEADLSIPFIYTADSLFYGLMVKGMIQNGWYWHNPHVGMPYGLDFLDFPRTDNLNCLLLKIISLLFPDYGITINLFFLLGFPLTAITSLYVFRHFKVSFFPALLGSLLYTFLPYHFFRNVGHLFLASYFLLPLMVMVILWVASEKSPLAIPGGKKEDGPRPRRGFHLRAAVIICLLVASGSTYYSFFACFFLMVAGILDAVRRRKPGPLVVAGALVGVICLGAILNLTPSLYHWYKNGRNPEVAHRSYIHAELYGMKISQLLLPIQHHRWSVLAEFKDRYNKSAPLVNENDVSSFGLIGSIGFLFLIAAVFSDRLRSWDAEIHSLSYLNLSGILLATIGGFSTLVAFFFSHIRAYNRISVVLAFFALLALSLAIEKWFRKSGPGHRKLLGAFCLLLLGIGTLDQTSPFFTPPHEKNKILHAQQAAFIGRMESQMPSRAMIFQLPYVPFPENPPVHRMEDYEHLGGGYLHSKELRWSYGAMKGREGDSWQKLAASKPVEEFLEMICLVGFQGLYIDRYGYEDGGVSLEKKITGILPAAPMVAANQRYVFYDLREYSRGLKRGVSEGEWEERKEKALHALVLSWSGGFSSLEGTQEDNWRWCSHEGVLVFDNPTARPRKVEVAMTLASGYEEPADMVISGDLFAEKLSVNSHGSPLMKTLLVPPGRHTVQFSTKAKRLEALSDPRTLVFRVNNFRLQELN